MRPKNRKSLHFEFSFKEEGFPKQLKYLTLKFYFQYLICWPLWTICHLLNYYLVIFPAWDGLFLLHSNHMWQWSRRLKNWTEMATFVSCTYFSITTVIVILFHLFSASVSFLNWKWKILIWNSIITLNLMVEAVVKN